MLINPLDDETVEEKDKKFHNLIEDLSKKALSSEGSDNNDEIQEYIDRLFDIYSDEYRHMYSKIYPIVMKISGGPLESAESQDNVSCLINNMEAIRNFVAHQYHETKDEKYAKLYTHIIKLSDHLNIDVQRVGLDNRLINDTECLKKSIKDNESSLDEISSKIERWNVEYVTILAIFSAIVIAFTGGLAVIGNALTDLSTIDPFMLMFSIILCGIVLFNTIAFLLNAISRLVFFRQISQKNKTDLLGYGYIIGFNVLMVALLLFSLCHLYCA